MPKNTIIIKTVTAVIKTFDNYLSTSDITFDIGKKIKKYANKVFKNYFLSENISKYTIFLQFIVVNKGTTFLFPISDGYPADGVKDLNAVQNILTRVHEQDNLLHTTVTDWLLRLLHHLHVRRLGRQVHQQGRIQDLKWGGTLSHCVLLSPISHSIWHFSVSMVSSIRSVLPYFSFIIYNHAYICMYICCAMHIYIIMNTFLTQRNCLRNNINNSQ